MPTRRYVTLACLALGACAPAPTTSEITVSDAWARATAPGQSTAAIYATLRNEGAADALVGVTSKDGTAMLHANDSSDGVARMRMLDAVPIPAGQSVRLSPGATHIMLGNLPAPLAAGTELAVTLRFRSGQDRTVRVAIVAPGAR